MPGRNPAAAIRYGTRHQKRRARDVARFVPGTLCRQVFPDGSVCNQPMLRGQKLDLGHAPDGSYIGLVHAACNRSAGSQALAIAQGKTLRRRRCEHCGQPYKASRREQRTCGAAACIAAVRRRAQYQLPLELSGRPW